MTKLLFALVAGMFAATAFAQGAPTAPTAPSAAQAPVVTKAAETPKVAATGKTYARKKLSVKEQLAKNAHSPRISAKHAVATHAKPAAGDVKAAQ
jgi:hypothetical protein